MSMTSARRGGLCAAAHTARQKGNITLAKALDVTRFEGGPEPGSFRSWSTKGLILNVKSDIDDELHITLG